MGDARIAAKASGAKKFVSSRTCNRGHSPTIRYTATGHCVECKAQAQRERLASPEGRANHKAAKQRWFASNSDRYRAWRREYEAGNRESINRQAGEWRAANTEKARATGRHFYRRHRKRLNAARVERNQNDRERQNAAIRRWREKNRERVYAHAKKRSRRVKRATTVWGQEGVLETYMAARRIPGAHVDHVVPLKHPKVCGLHNVFNLRIIPAEENLRKHNRYEV